MIKLPYYIEDPTIGRLAEFNHATNTIAVSPEAFYSLPEILQCFTLWHEARHEDLGWNPDYARDENIEIQCDIYAVDRLVEMGYLPFDIINLTRIWHVLTDERREAISEYTQHRYTSGFTAKREDAVWAEIYNVFGGKEGYDALPEPTKESIRVAVADLDRKSNLWKLSRLQEAAANIAVGFANAVKSGTPMINVDDIQEEMKKTSENNNIMYIIAAVAAVAILIFIVYLFKKKKIIA